MVELIRRLTADYSELEYKEWLNEDESYLDYFEVARADGSYVFVDPKLYKKIEPEDVITIDDTYTLKDIACALDEVASKTGYESELLYSIFMDKLKDGDTPKEAFDHVACVSHEMDW